MTTDVGDIICINLGNSYRFIFCDAEIIRQEGTCILLTEIVTASEHRNAGVSRNDQRNWAPRMTSTGSSWPVYMERRHHMTGVDLLRCQQPRAPKGCRNLEKKRKKALSPSRNVSSLSISKWGAPIIKSMRWRHGDARVLDVGWWALRMRDMDTLLRGD